MTDPCQKYGNFYQWAAVIFVSKRDDKMTKIMTWEIHSFTNEHIIFTKTKSMLFKNVLLEI